MHSIAGRRFATITFIVIVVFTSLVAGTAAAAPMLQAQGGWTNYGTYPTQAACAAAARTNAQGHTWKCVPAQGAFTLLVLV